MRGLIWKGVNACCFSGDCGVLLKYHDKNPFINAFVAALYITAVASVMYYGPKIAGRIEETVVVPIAIISLFTLSAAVMGYVFLYQPLQLYLEGDKKTAVNLFLKTVVIFGGITAVILVSLF